MNLGEFELINRLTALLKKTPSVDLGIGDDTAVVPSTSGKLLLTCDALVEGSHFLLEWKELVEEFFFLLGRKLVSVSVSDVASMGGAPLYSLITIGVNETLELRELESLYRGVESALEFYGLSLVGGDTVKSKNVFFDLFLVGEVSNGFMTRSGAEPGDLVFVTGTFGDAKAGLEQLLKGRVVDTYLVERFLNPQARLREGQAALSAGVRCGTDVSDGLVFNLYTVADSSNVKIEIDLQSIPLSQNLISYCGMEKALSYALFGGEDYELIITAPPEKEGELREAGFKPIGRVVEGKGVYGDGKLLPKYGYDHLKGGGVDTY